MLCIWLRLVKGRPRLGSGQQIGRVGGYKGLVEERRSGFVDRGLVWVVCCKSWPGLVNAKCGGVGSSDLARSVM